MSLRLLPVFLLAAGLGVGADIATRPSTPPVLRNSEPADTAVVILPGPSAHLPGPPAGSELEPRQPAEGDVRAGLPQQPESRYPAGFRRDPGAFCQNQIGRWTEADALRVLGGPSRRRPAADDDGADGSGGHILAFPDPNARYREIELDFDRHTGVLRSVFAYPKDLNWQECRRTWSGSFTATQANKGRTFYSFTTRRLDVLVDATGRVISLGLY